MECGEEGGEIMFKYGDRVTIRRNKDNDTGSNRNKKLTEGYIKRVNNQFLDIPLTYIVYSREPYDYLGQFEEEELRPSLKPLRHKLSLMKKLSLIAKRLLDKDLGDLVKAGILNEELNVEDTDFVLAFIVTEYKKEMAIEARKILKAKRKCEEDEEE